jgi:tape measure domain-containing protein
VSVVANVAINVDSSGATQSLRQFQTQTERTSQAVNNLKFDALQRSINALPGGLGLAANGIADFSRQLNNAGITAKATTAQIIALQAAISSKKLQLAGAGGIGGEKIKAEIAGLESQLGGLSNAAKGVSPALLVAGAGAIALAAGLAVGAGAALKFSNEIDRNRQQLTLFTKNVEATNAIIADLKTTADATSLGLPGLLEATKTLAAYGVSAKVAGTATKLLGDLALGDNEKLQRFAVNLGQISSIGKAYTVDLKQFAMAGIPIFEALAKVMGTSTGEVLRLAEQGKVTYPIVIKAINELTKEGASFFNGAEKGGTDLDRSLNQLTGTFENLQTIVGTAVGPAVTQVIKGVQKSLQDVVFVIQRMQAELNKLKFPPGFVENGQKIGIFPRSFDQLSEGVKKTALSFNPLTAQLTNSINLFKILGTYYEKFGFGKNFAVPDKTAVNAAKSLTVDDKKAQIQKLLDDASAKDKIRVETELANLRIENSVKKAKLDKNTELQLSDNRFQYEQQIADFRESTIRRIADMERTLQDQRIKANFDLQQSQLKLAGTNQFIGQTQDISRAIVSGKSPADIQSLETARDNAKTLNDAAVTRKQIEFDSTMKKIQLERTLTDFKKGIEREIGEMQKSYARQVDGILRTAGRSLGELMVEGAKKAKEIMDGVNPTGGNISEIAKNGFSATQLKTATQAASKFTGVANMCSESVKAFYKSLGITLPGVTALADSVRKAGTVMTDFSKIKPGDILASNKPGGPQQHVGVYTGGQNVFHQSSSRGLKAGNYPDLNSFKGGYFVRPKAATPQRGPVAAALQAPAGSRAMQVDAANSIKPYSPATGKLEQETKKLQQLQTQSEINAKLTTEKEIRKSLADSTQTVLKQSRAGLDTAIQKNQLDQRTLDLIVSGTNPALAAQFAQNEQLNAQNMAALENQKTKVGLSAEDLNFLNQQIAAGPQILENLNQQAIKQKEISDATARRSIIPNFIASAQTQLKDLESVAVRVSQGIGDAVGNSLTKGVQGLVEGTTTAQQVFADFLKTVGDILMQEGAKMIATYTAIAIAKSLAGLFGGGSSAIAGGGVFGGAASSSTFNAGTSTAFGGMSIPGFAAGGNPPVGKASLVGEKGPELFVPRTSGTIVPADATAAAMARYQRQGSSNDEPDPVAAMARYQRQDGNFAGMGAIGRNGSTTNIANNTISNGYNAAGSIATNGYNNTNGDTTNNGYNTAGGNTTNNGYNTAGSNTTNNGYDTAGNNTTTNGYNTASGDNTTNNGYNANGDTVNNIQTSPSPVLSLSFETTRFLGQDYVSTDQLQKAMMATEKRAAAAGAKAAAAQITNKLQQSPAYRKQVGLR